MNLSVPSGEGLRVREAEVTDIPGIRDLERRAGAPFREVGLDAVADDEPPTAKTLRIAVRRGEVFVVEDHSPSRGPGHGPVAWMWLSTADGDLLLEQVSVDPDYRGKRIGSALIQGAVDRGRAEGFTGVVLTTFRDIPWNGPLYRRLGFETMQDAEIGPELRAIRRRETEAGLDVLERECLRKRITR